MDAFTNVEKSVRVWSFDGGGKGVLLQLIIVDKLMRHIQWKQGLKEVPRPCDHADVMIGTGLGGAAAIFMGRLRLTASEAYEDIVQLGQSVFNKPSTSLTKPFFSLETLKSTLGSILERRGYESDIKIIEDKPSSKKCHLIVLACSKTDVTRYKSLRTYASPKGFDCTVVDAIAATMAIPDWFEPVVVGSGYEQQALIGGCMGYNNPTWEGLLEAKQIFGVDARVTSLISIGPGKSVPPAPVTTEGRDGYVEQMNADCEQTAVRLSGYFRSIPAYIRVSVDSLMNVTDVSNWNEGAIITINERATSYLDQVEVKNDIDRAVTNLLQGAGEVTLGKLTQAAAPRIAARSVPRLTPYYVPRPEIHEQMERCLNGDFTGDQRMLVIHGMAGSGKTQSASFFERTHHKRYNHVFFFDASSVASIQADLQSAIRSLGGSHFQDTFEDAIQYLKSMESGHWLIIFDNADDPNLPLIDHIPFCDHGHIIITTRNPDLALLAPSSHVNMPTMEQKEALSVLFLAAQLPKPETKNDHEHAIEICKLIGNLPLALVQVGCYCYSSKTSFSQYQERFKEHRQRLMNTRPSWQLDQYPHSAYTSISISYSLLDDSEKSLLHVLAFFHSSSIRVDILRLSAKHHFSVDPDGQLVKREDYHERQLKFLQELLTKDGEWNQPHLDELLMHLQSLSIVSLGSDDGSMIVTIHPLVQSFAQDILTSEASNDFLYLATITLSGCIWDEENHLFRYLLQHIWEIESQKVQPHINDGAAFGYIFLVMGSYQESLHRWEKIRDICRERLEGNHRSIIVSTNWVARCLLGLGKYEEAEAEIRIATSIQERDLGRSHDDTAQSYRGLAVILQRQGKMQEAEKILRDNIQIGQSKHGKNHPITLATAATLGANLYHQGNLFEAEVLFREIVPIMKRVLSKDYPETSTAALNFIQVLLKLGKWEEAEPYIQHEIERSVRLFGLESVNTATPLQHLATCVRQRGDLKEAERIQRFVSEIRKKHFGEKDPRLIKTQETSEESIRLKEKQDGTGNSNSSVRTVSWGSSKLGFMSFVIVVVLAVLAMYFS